MYRKIPVPKFFTDNGYEISKDPNDETYEMSMFVVKAIQNNSLSISEQFNLIRDLVDYLFLVYSENREDYYSPDVCSPNLDAYKSSIRTVDDLTLESIAGDIDYYSDRWCWWRVWNVYRMMIEIKRLYELEELL